MIYSRINRFSDNFHTVNLRTYFYVVFTPESLPFLQETYVSALIRWVFLEVSIQDNSFFISKKKKEEEGT